MKHLLLIHADEEAWEGLDEGERLMALGEVAPLLRDLRARRQLLGLGQLQPTATATTVRVREGRTLVTDGPYAETKEQLGGYWLVSCQPEQATEIARAIAPRRVPGGVEVRALVER